MESVVIFWFRRDLRLDDNEGLQNAFKSQKKVLPIFIFDQNILENLPANDQRISLIYDFLKIVNGALNKRDASLHVFYGKPEIVFQKLMNKYPIAAVYTNKDYEPYAKHRDAVIKQLLEKNKIAFYSFKDQVIYEENELLKDDGSPYTVYTPYQKKWVKKYTEEDSFKRNTSGCFVKQKRIFPKIETIGFQYIKNDFLDYKLPKKEYSDFRDFPSQDVTSNLSIHLRFGTVSVRKIAQYAINENFPFLRQLIWREFYMQIVYHYPKVITQNFKKQYDAINWRNDEKEFEKWCNGMTGYPLIDAGMRQLNQTGRMHNRVRMICAGFLCKHLLIDWRWGEAYFAQKLLDYDLALNNGNWQWVAGTGCDAAPYFRIFNPTTQLKKFDSDLHYVKKWISDYDELSYPQPMVDHKYARERCLEAFKKSGK